MKEIKKIGVLAIAKIMALLYLVGSAVIMVPYSLFVLTQGGVTKEGVRWWFFLGLPAFYYLISFAVVALGAMLYNFLSARIGGIKMELNEEENAAG
ncbi:MAG: hypothetical protein WC628_06595 [Candidatus Omnitrophota bacterium]